MTGIQVKESTLREFGCTVNGGEFQATSGLCAFRLDELSPVTWATAIEFCRANVAVSTLPTMAQIQEVSTLSGSPFKKCSYGPRTPPAAASPPRRLRGR